MSKPDLLPSGYKPENGKNVSMLRWKDEIGLLEVFFKLVSARVWISYGEKGDPNVLSVSQSM